MLHKAAFYRNPGIFCAIFHIIIQNPSEAKTRVGSNLFSLNFSRLFSGKSVCTVVIT